jgi:hypothetical protein
VSKAGKETTTEKDLSTIVMKPSASPTTINPRPEAVPIILIFID